LQASICHYSFHRLWKQEGWDTHRLCQEVHSCGVRAVDFHAGLLGEKEGVVERIRPALKETGLELSGLSLSTNFSIRDPEAYRQMIKDTREWMRIAAELEAPASRIFGGSFDRTLPAAEYNEARKRVVDALAALATEAEELGLILALENHGGLPCTGEEQVDMIEEVGSDSLRATIDVGNYMACGQEAEAGTRAAARYCAYVHFKDFRKRADDSKPWGWTVESCTVGQGDVDHVACLQELKEAGYDGFIALEYEGPGDERAGVRESIEYMKGIMGDF